MLEANTTETPACLPHHKIMFNLLANRGNLLNKEHYFIILHSFSGTILPVLWTLTRAYEEKLEKTLNVRQIKQEGKKKKTPTKIQLASAGLEFREGLDCIDYNTKKGICFPVNESV